MHHGTSKSYHELLWVYGFVPFGQFYVFPRAKALRVQDPYTLEAHGITVTITYTVLTCCLLYIMYVGYMKLVLSIELGDMCLHTCNMYMYMYIEL